MPAGHAGAAAIFAGVINPFTFAVAVGAGAGQGKESLLKADLAVAGAGLTCLGICPGLGAGAVAGFARLVAWNLNLGLKAERCIFKGDRQIVTQIITASSAATSSAATTEDVAEDVAKNVLKGGSAETAGREAALPIDSGMTVLIIERTFLTIRKDGISLGKLLEAFLSLFVARVFVRVTFQRQLTVGFFDLGIAGVLVNLKNLVIIAFGQNITLQVQG